MRGLTERTTEETTSRVRRSGGRLRCAEKTKTSALRLLLRLLLLLLLLILRLIVDAEQTATATEQTTASGGLLS